MVDFTRSDRARPRSHEIGITFVSACQDERDRHHQVMVISFVFRTRQVAEPRKNDISSRALPPPGRPVGRT